jgi:hypothetical protein
MGLIQIRRFLDNSSESERALAVQGSQRGAADGAADTGVAEHFQPMWMRLPGQ